MKRIFLILISVLCLAASVEAAGNGRKSVTVSNFEMVQDADIIDVKFDLHIGKKLARTGYVFTVIPVLVNGDDRMEFEPVTVMGKRAGVLHERRAVAYPATAAKGSGASPVAGNGETVSYSVTFPYEGWMPGSDLRLESINQGCCSAVRSDLGLIAGNIITPLPDFFVQESVIVQGPKLTTGDKMAEKFVFVKPIDEYDLATGFRRDGTITVYFHQSKYNIDRYYRENNESLIDILSAIREIEESDDSRISKVVIAGYASPEGPYEFNMQLAENRAAEVRKFITDNSTLSYARFALYNGGIDWDGLREMVAASEMPDKFTILDIIDNSPVWDPVAKRGRLGDLMRVRNGDPYRYMYRNFFPELRNAAYITIYYDNL